MLGMGGFLRRLYVFCAGMALLGVIVPFTMPTDAIAKETIKFVEKIGSQGSDEGQFSYILDIAIDGSGNLYVAEDGNKRIQKITSEGNFSAQVNSFQYDVNDDGKQDTVTFGLYYIAVSKEGNLYALGKFSSETNSDLNYYKAICEFSSDLGFISRWSYFNNPVNDYPRPDYITVGRDGSVYVVVVDNAKYLIVKFTQTGSSILSFQVDAWPSHLAVDSEGYIYLAFNDGSKIDKYSPEGEFVGTIHTPMVRGMGGTPSFFVVDDMGDIYTFYPSQDCVLKFDSNGELLADWFISDDDDTAGQFDGTYFRGIAVDDGYIYVGSYDKGCILKFIVEGKKEGFVVNTTGDESDADKSDGVCDVDLSEDGEQCTLRAAIDEVNRSKGNDTNTITFDIPTTDTGYSTTTGTATFTISPKKALPDIKKTVVIDAASQSNGTVELDGKDAGKANGLSVQREDVTIKGMNIRNFSKDGIQAKSDVFLKNTKISSNKGSGVSSRTDITIEGTDNEFSDNGKSGIMSTGKVDADNAVLQVENNGGFGIYAKGPVRINGGGSSDFNTIPYEGQTSKISNNGSGGIFSDCSRAHEDDARAGGSYLEVTGNGHSVDKDSDMKYGNGIFTISALVSLSRSVKVNKNNRYGVLATKGGVAEDGVTGVWVAGTDNECSDNGKSGIYANNGGVSIGVIQVENNGGFGIGARGDVTINVTSQSKGGTETAYSTETSKISNNGKDGILAKKDTSGSDGGSVDAFNLEVTNNKGAGIRVENDLTLNGGNICDNVEGNLIVGGGKNLTDVTVCESVSTVETQGNTMLDMELSVEGSGCAENEELDSLNIKEAQDVAAITQEDEK